LNVTPPVSTFTFRRLILLGWGLDWPRSRSRVVEPDAFSIMILEVVKTSGVFKRIRVPLRHKVRAYVMYMAGLNPGSHVAVHPLGQQLMGTDRALLQQPPIEEACHALKAIPKDVHAQVEPPPHVLRPLIHGDNSEDSVLEDKIDAVRTVEGYLRQADWRSRENSNLSYSFSSVFLHLAGVELVVTAGIKII